MDMEGSSRAPLEGDHVTILASHEEVYRVIRVGEKFKVVDLEMIAAPHYAKADVPWGSLVYLPKPTKRPEREDVNQAAARIVREATDKV